MYPPDRAKDGQRKNIGANDFAIALGVLKILVCSNFGLFPFFGIRPISAE